MKANQFAKNEDAVSPVIGVILMVAITVVLAAVVFVLVTKLSGNQQNASESASVSMSSPQSGYVYITLVKGGQNVPYTVADGGAFTSATAGATTASDVVIQINAKACAVTHNGASATTNAVAGLGTATLQDSNSNKLWDAGETIKLPKDCANAAMTPNTTYLVSVSVHGTLLQDNTKVVVS